MIFTREGKAVEVRIEGGAVLSVFDAVHDVSHLASFPEEQKSQIAQFRLMQILYSKGEKSSTDEHHTAGKTKRFLPKTKLWAFSWSTLD